MKPIVALICCGWLLAGCADHKDQDATGPSQETDSILAAEPADTVIAAPSVPDPYCQFDSVSFRDKMGIGLVSLNYSGYPFPLFKDPNGQGDTIWVEMAPKSFYQVALSDTTLGQVSWFHVPTEYDGGAVIWRDTTKDGAIGLGWNETAPTLWLMPDTVKKNQGRSFAHLWEEALGRTIWLRPSSQADNPLRKSPHDTAEIVPYPTEGYQLYAIREVDLPWVRVNHLLEKNGVYGSDTWSDPIGWMKWYCGDSQRVAFLNAYELEDYYVEE